MTGSGDENERILGHFLNTHLGPKKLLYDKTKKKKKENFGCKSSLKKIMLAVLFFSENR